MPESAPGPDAAEIYWSVPYDVVKPEWIARNIQQGHGLLGAAYPDVAYVMEGDTPSYLSLISMVWTSRSTLTLAVGEDVTETNWKPSGQLKVQPRPETRPLWTNAETPTPLLSSARFWIEKSRLLPCTSPHK